MSDTCLSFFLLAWREYYVHHLPLVTEQVPHIHQLLPSLITLNAKGLLTPVQPVHGAISNWDTCKINQQLTDCIARSFDGCSSAPEKESSVAALHIQDNDKKRRKETNSRFALSERLQFTKESNKDKKLQESDEQPFKSQVVMGAEKKRGKEEEMQIAKGEMERLKECLEALQLDVKKLTTKLSQITEEKSHEIRVLKNKEQQQIVKKQTYDLLPEADTNLSALQTSVESSAQTLVLLAAQWEKHRAPLLAQYRDARERNSNKASESQKKVDALRNLREKSRELGEEVRHKEQLHSQLVTEYEKVTKDINRSAYTRRIMEIIGNISKQKEEIDKVLKDTKDLQKEINNLTGQLDRSFTVADELIFRDAKRDETARRAYKLLATLHSDCSELVQMVEETGATVREIRDLEEQIETERAKNVGANLDRISADLRQMKQETAALTAQLNAKS
ncbi:hypothetical protein B7P43_G01570 [Cryptotermes secundus]|uniref:Coiled-coil domain-containing protein 22 homolog n=1 Tax=Cryptotermes secundus TaxID=105785 RepID=A0A2J7RHP8_9NEOP|nr:hypothetical protein B7P43_G01570 [Cryptotermes secundus]